jgi:phosphoribosylanthranilate isomerase
MFRVKICGVTSVADALIAAEAGADAIGLNCFAGSRRYCSLEVAREIAAALPPHVRKVGVFVKAPAAEIRATVAALGLDLVQLHGDEPVEFLMELRPLAVAKVFRMNEQCMQVGEYVAQSRRQGCLPRMAFVDAFSDKEFGGTGAVFDWQALASQRREFAGMPLVLAGGLTPDNVSRAIKVVRPWAVDTASGVEDSPSHKSAEKVRAFVAAAIEAFSQMRM